MQKKVAARDSISFSANLTYMSFSHTNTIFSLIMKAQQFTHSHEYTCRTRCSCSSSSAIRDASAARERYAGAHGGSARTDSPPSYTAAPLQLQPCERAARSRATVCPA
eukprot:10712-Heterococcus_DN1.PRE.2